MHNIKRVSIQQRT